MKNSLSFRSARTLVSVRAILVLAVLINSMAAPIQATSVQAAGSECATSGPVSGFYTVTPCITGPSSGASASGDLAVSANFTTTGANPGVAKMIFYLNGQYLITDYQAPYTFSLPTNKFVDGSQLLEVEALMKDGFTSQRASITLTFDNGVTQPPVNNNSFTISTGTSPQPGQPFTLVAAGDGADGASNSSYVTDLIASWNPNMFFYLGDVYEKGSPTEFYNWYGPASAFYGRFRSITNPIVGNHEYENGVAVGYFDYWNNVPSYYSYDAAGWHFIALNSNCGLRQDCAVGQAQYQWLQDDLNTHNNACTIAYFHHPVFNVGPEGFATSMNDMWALMAQHGVDIVLTGHDHDYQRWVPLDGNGNPSSAGTTEFVVGTGGHGIQNFMITDSRMAVGYDTSPYSFGALRLQLNQDGAGFQYINYQGLVLDSGAIPCSGAPADTTPPSAPANLAANAYSATQVNLSWNTAADNVGVVGYDIYRDGSLLTSVGAVTSYSDSNLSLGATYQYQVSARDAANNTSGLGNTATISMPSLLFNDGFESGSLSNWTSTTNFTVTQLEHYAGSYAARATGNGTSASFASKTLGTTQSDLYYSTAFKILSQGTTSAYLLRFRTATNGAILGVFVSGTTGKLGMRNDVNATSTTNGPSVSQNVWHQLQVHLQINGASSLVEVWLDGTQAATLTKTDSLGTNPIGRIQLGDSSATDVYDIAYDEIAANNSFINTTDSVPPSAPTGVSANATGPNSVNLTWDAATDNISVTGYDLYRNGALLATVGTVTSYTDIPVSPSFTYQYQVRAHDGAGNISDPSSPAEVTTPADTTAPTVTLTAPTDGLTVSGSLTLSADAIDDVGVEHVDFLVNGTVVGTVGEGGPYWISWDSTSLTDGTQAVITAQAVDAASNTAVSDPRSVTVNNAAGDSIPPTVPTGFTAVAGGTSRADLTWTASSDNIGVSAYDIFRDGAPLTSVGAVTSYSDTTVVSGATYQYQIQARDAAGNLSAFATASPVTIPLPLFGDGFESGDLTQWTNNGLAIQSLSALEGAYDARGTNNGTAATYASKALAAAKNDLYYTTWFKISSQGATSAYLQRFRTTGNGAILGVFVSSTGKLGYRNDVSAASTTSTLSVSHNVWHQLQTHVLINGTSSQVEVWFDGTQVAALSKTESLGTNPIGRIQLGDSQSSDIFDIAFDEVTLDTSLIRSSSMPYTSIDSGPSGSVASNTASIGFSSPTVSATFECSLDGAAFGACTSPQAYTGLIDGAHTFAVRALDALATADPTPAGSTWSVDTIAPVVTSTTPVDAATDVSITSVVEAIFSEAPTPASITTNNFTLVPQGDTTPIPATLTVDPVTNKATLHPGAPLAYLTTYVANITGGAGGPTDLAGNPLTSNVVWTFTTISSDITPPTVTLMAPLDGASVSGSAVTLSADAADDTAVDYVDFLVNGLVVGTATTAPYSLTWNSTTIPNGPAVITAQAFDTLTNSSISAASNVTIANDITPPDAPANLAANVTSGAQVDLTWTASTDDVGVTGYDIFRDGAQLATVGAQTSYSDTTTAPSSTYQYQVRAMDAAGNLSALSSAASAATPAVLFTDRFEGGNLSHWTVVNGLALQQAEVYAGAYAARATSTGQVSNALAQFDLPQYDLYYVIRFNILNRDTLNSVYIQRFRKADTLSALGVYVSPTGKLGYRNDVNGGSNTSTVNVSTGTWHQIQTHVRIDSAGGPGLVEMWFDGAPIFSQAEALGNAPITRIQLGDSTLGRTYDIAFDDVAAAPFLINPGDVTPPGTPANFVANASAANIIDLTWDASTDNLGVTGYDLYRNGNLLIILGAVTSYSDTAVVPSTTYQYAVRARDAAENISAASAATATTPADTTPPTVTLTAPASGATLFGTIAMTATAVDDVGVAHVEFLVNGAVVNTDTTAPYSFDWNSTSVPDGPVTITARAVDTSNNAALSAEAVITVDNTPPDTTITASPLAFSKSNTASFSFTATEANVTFECALDGTALAVCTSPKTYAALTNGAHSFQVRATDAAGHIDSTPAVWNWTVDTVLPTVTSIFPTNNANNVPPVGSITATFSEAIDPATLTTTTFTVKRRQGNNPPLAATVTYDPLTKKATLKPTSNLASQTSYTVTVMGGASGVKDMAGNALSANYSWNFSTGVLDLTAPTVSITSPANGASVRGSITLSASASDNVAVGYVDFLVNGALVGTDAASPYSLSWNTAALADGPAVITARAYDTSNNSTTSAGVTVTVDNTVPDTTISAGPTGTVTSTSASFSFSSSEASVTYNCKLDGGNYTACTSPKNYTGLAGGVHTFYVRASDAAGNVDATPASQSWTVVVPPDTSISAGPSGTVTSTSASFSFTSTQNGSTFTCSLDGATFSACTSPIAYTNLSNGSHTFQVAAIYQGITDPTPASRTWTINLAPDTTITAGPTGTVSSTSASFSFTSTQSGSTFTCSLDGGAFSTCTSPAAYTNLTSGSHTFLVAAIYQGNTDPTPASRTWTVDAIAPTGVAVTAPSNGASVTGQVTISASASDNVGVVSVRFYVDGQLIATDTSSPFNVNWNTRNISKTTHTLYVIATDAAGNTTQSATITVTVR
jgi:fibronectin type 3 domain-containing protein